MGLHKFDLGYIPASVTPPRTWRRAAWFTIFSSAAALVGLLFVTSVLVSPVHVADNINSLPGLPTDLPFFTPPSSSDRPSSSRHDQLPNRPRQSQQPNRPTADNLPTGAPAAPPSSTDGAGSAVGGPPQTGTSPASAISTTVLPLPPATVTTVSTGPAAVDPNKIGARTESFFSEVTRNVDAAANLTAGTVHDDAKAIIQQNYGGISTIKIKSISLDPGSGLTVSVLQVTNKDGTVSTEQRTLQFTLTGDPKIVNPGG
jgi:hypothetical protein